MAYDKKRDYMAEMNQAAAQGDYKTAARLEQERNKKIAGEGLGQYKPTQKYAGWLDSTDYSKEISRQIAAGESADTVEQTARKRQEKALGTAGLEQYADDNVYRTAMEYVQSQRRAAQPFTYRGMSEYTSRNQGEIDKLTAQLLNREKFSYDPEKDPLYQQYREQYTREGQRAMEDTLAQVSARTGGLASSYAGLAAQQQNDYYMAQLADRIPELKQMAYQMYQSEGDRMRSDLDLLRALDGDAYGRYQDAWSRDMSEREFARQQAQDIQSGERYDREWAYQKKKDAYDRQWNEEERGYQRQQDDYNRQWNEEERAYQRQQDDYNRQWNEDEREYQRRQDTLAMAAKMYSGGAGRGSGSAGPQEDENGIVDTMLAMGDDTKAREYLLGLGLNQWQTQEYQDLYKQSKGTSRQEQYMTAQGMKKSLASSAIPDEKKLDAIQGALETGSISEADAEELLAYIGYDDKRLG